MRSVVKWCLKFSSCSGGKRSLFSEKRTRNATAAKTSSFIMNDEKIIEENKIKMKKKVDIRAKKFLKIDSSN
jgi:tyrosine-protein phosphatase YwqE